MMNFGESTLANYDDFQFNMRTGAAMENVMRNTGSFQRPNGDNNQGRQDNNNLAINTQFANQNSPFSTMPPPGSAFASPLHPNHSLDMDMTSPYQHAMSMPLNMADPSFGMMGNMLTPNPFNASMMESPIHQEFGGLPPQPQDPTAGNFQNQDQFASGGVGGPTEIPSGVSSRTASQDQNSARPNSRPLSDRISSKSLTPHSSAPLQPASGAITQRPQQHDVPVDAFKRMAWTTTPPGKYHSHYPVICY